MTNFRNLVLLKGYSNYFNRIIKREANLQAYKNAALSYKELVNINFNPNDGVNTSVVVNVDEYDSQSDYLLVVNFDYAPNYTIDSCWYIISAERTRAGQYKLSLKRDVVADKYDQIIQAPCYINKATLTDYTNPLIFNSEGLNLNQIKTSETFLQDTTKSAWIVAYLSKGKISADITSSTDYPIFETLDSTIEQWEYAAYTKTNPWNGFIQDWIYMLNIFHIHFVNFSLGEKWKYNYNSKFEYIDTTPSNIPGTPKLRVKADVKKNEIPSLLQGYISSNKTQINNKFIQEFLDEAKYNDIYKYDGKYVKDSSNKIYKISVKTGTLRRTGNIEISSNVHPLTYSALVASLTTNGQLKNNLAGEIDDDTFKSSYSYIPVYITYQQITNVTVHVDTTGTNDTVDQPYDIMAIPFCVDGDLYAKNGNDINKLFAPIDALNFINNLYTAKSDSIYDLQLLPYCPIPNINSIQSGSSVFIDISSLTANKDYKYLRQTSDSSSLIKTLALFPTTANFSIQINMQVNVPELEGCTLAESYKISNEADMYRLSSPNYNGQFEFSLAKNYGITSFDVDCTYVPYNPYIHINPNFKGLYGQDFDDARGLICGGDFSLPLTTSAWSQYQQQNKNYQIIFDRQIQNMEVNNKINTQQSLVNSGVGLLGNLVSGNYGGVAAGTLSTASNLYFNDRRFNEQKSYTSDLFNYQLGNIKAMPNSLTRVSSLNANNKIFPVLEYYTCTENEKKALKNKLKYNGMTVMTIGKIEDYLQEDISFISGNIIRLQDIAEDTHFLNDVYNEISMGVFIK